jgi:hypothetical protein
MSIEEEDERLGAEYRAALGRAQESEEFWRANPIAYTVAEGARVPATPLGVLLEAGEYGTPDEALAEAMAALDRWRAFRAAHGMP